MYQYSPAFFDHISPGSHRSASKVLPAVLDLVPTRSAVDVGCGTGQWLAVAAQLGVREVLGIDGEYVDRSQLAIPEGRFRPIDLSRLGGKTWEQCFGQAEASRYDLCISLEVAEHLPASAAAPFVRLLCELSPVVLFSAAIPGQGGQNHLNERFLTYWARLFARHAFMPIDALRPQIWEDAAVEWWYRQNILLFAHKDAIARSPRLSAARTSSRGDALDRVHPANPNRVACRAALRAVNAASAARHPQSQGSPAAGRSSAGNPPAAGDLPVVGGDLSRASAFSVSTRPVTAERVAPRPAKLIMRLFRAGQLAAAEAACRARLEVADDDAETAELLGLVLSTAGRLFDAMHWLRRAVELVPSSPDFHNNLGTVLARLGMREAAVSAFGTAARLSRKDPKMLANLGVALHEVGRHDDAAAVLTKATRSGRATAEQWFRLGAASRKVYKPDAAAEALGRALELAPDHHGARRELVGAHSDVGDTDAAIATLAELVDRCPTWASVHSDYLFLLLHRRGHEPGVIAGEAKRWAARHETPWAGRRRPHEPRPLNGRRLRVGYVSPDLRSHPVATFFEGVLANHDQDRVEVICYSDVDKPDATTRRLLSMADGWRDTVGTYDSDVERLIRDEDRIDVLVDLTGHTGGNRLGLFARKPAPVQGTYLGFIDTTGMETMDFYPTDHALHPLDSGADPHFTEHLWRLPRTCWCFTPDADFPAETSAAPVAKNGHVTFASLNRMAKLTSAMIESWAEILRGVPGSRLIVLTGDSTMGSQRLADAFAHHGVETGRVETVGRTSRWGYLRLFERADIHLDTFPFNGQTVTCNAAWMGLPSITLAGPTMLSRAGLSIMTTLGLPEAATHDSAGYVRAAVNMAADTDRLVRLRSEMRDRMASGPLRDGKSLAAALEEAYFAMWDRAATGDEAR